MQRDWPNKFSGGVYFLWRYVKAVVDRAKKAICGFGTLLLCYAVLATGAERENPYQSIIDRNVFGLKPPPPPGKPEEKKVDLPPIILTGITTIFGNKRVLLNVQPPGKPIQSLILAEGQREADIEVLEIDEKTGSVKVNQSGTVLPLTLDKHGAKLPPATAAVPPGTPPPAGVPLPNAPPTPYVPGAPPPVTTGGLKTIPRQIRLPQAPQPGFQPPAPPVPGQ